MAKMYKYVRLKKKYLWIILELGWLVIIFPPLKCWSRVTKVGNEGMQGV